jgi:Holliday junction resolvase RusA-like endonuclease
MTGLALAFALRIAPAGKERPRVTKHGTFMPHAYEAWRSAFRWMVRSQIPPSVLPRLPLISRLYLAATFTVPGGSMNPDLDNALGAILDAIQVPPVRTDKQGRKRGGGWGLMVNDSQIKRLAGVVEDGPTGIRFNIVEIA